MSTAGAASPPRSTPGRGDGMTTPRTWPGRAVAGGCARCRGIPAGSHPPPKRDHPTRCRPPGAVAGSRWSPATRKPAVTLLRLNHEVLVHAPHPMAEDHGGRRRGPSHIRSSIGHEGATKPDVGGLCRRPLSPKTKGPTVLKDGTCCARPTQQQVARAPAGSHRGR
jgi:hypothetical protein